MIEASAQVYVNGMPLVRTGDRTQHCGAIGKMTTGAAIVADGSPPMMTAPTPMLKSINEPIKSTIKDPVGGSAVEPALEPLAPEAPAPVSAASAPPSAPGGVASATSIAGGTPLADMPTMSPILKSISDPIKSIIRKP